MSVNKQIDSLTGIRFFAAMMIFVHHCGAFMPLNHGLRLASGVTFFFVLSGFVLTYSYYEKLGKLSFGKFMLLRFFRLWPAHVVMLAIALLVKSRSYSQLINNYTELELFSILTLMQAWYIDRNVYWGWNGPAWSISAEMFFYCMFPFILSLMKQSIVRTVLFVLVITFVWTHVFWYFFGDMEIKGNLHGILGINPVSRIKEFVIGMCVGCITVKFSDRYLSSEYLPKGVVKAAEIVVLLLVVLIIIYDLPVMRFLGGYVDVINLRYLNYIVLASCFALFILFCATQKLRILSILCHPLVVYCGKISFAFYLAHGVVIRAIKKHMLVNGVLSAPEAIAVSFVCSLLLSIFIYHFVEIPCMRLAKRKLVNT